MCKTSKYKASPCNECGEVYQPRRCDELFCSTPCRKAFDNRAMVRGRDLYHLFMTMRYERGAAKLLGVWAIVCRMAMEWRQEDERQRAGRKSWIAPKKAIDKLPVVVRSSDTYVGKIKIGRSL